MKVEIKFVAIVIRTYCENFVAIFTIKQTLKKLTVSS